MSLGFALIIFLTIACISVVSNILITNQFNRYLEQEQAEYAEELARGLAPQYDRESGWNVDYIHGMGMYALNDGYILKVFDSEGEVVWDAENHDMESCHQAMKEIEERLRKIAGGKVRRVFQTYPIVEEDDEIGRVEIVYYTPSYLDDHAFKFVDSLNIILVITGTVSICAAVCVGVLFAKRISRPIGKVTTVADEISRGNYFVRAENQTGTVELEELRGAINHMAERIEQQETLRKRLTSDVAHELRTPLTNLSAQLEMIAEGVFEPTEERLRSIYEEVNCLSALVSELEKLQQIESNALQKRRFDLFKTVQDTVIGFQAEMDARGLTCTVSGEPAVLFADENKVRQVVTNLLSNAVKYSRGGGTIACTVRNDEENVIFSVADNGIGISKEEQKLIFERFYRTDKSRSRATGGVGIGLTIVSAIVTAHGGSIEVESEEGKGSVFTVSLPKGGEE